MRRRRLLHDLSVRPLLLASCTREREKRCTQFALGYLMIAPIKLADQKTAGTFSLSLNLLVVCAMLVMGFSSTFCRPINTGDIGDEFGAPPCVVRHY